MRRNPYSDSRENSYLLQAYVTQENGRAKMGDVLYTGTPEKCRELMGQLKSGELTEGDVKQLYAKAQETAQTAGQDKDTFSIYQIKGGDETRDFRFEPYDRLQRREMWLIKRTMSLSIPRPLRRKLPLKIFIPASISTTQKILRTQPFRFGRGSASSERTGHRALR